MRKKVSRRIAAVMLLAGIAFVRLALSHPEMSWPWSNAVSYVLYSVYLTAMVILFIAPFKT